MKKSGTKLENDESPWYTLLGLLSDTYGVSMVVQVSFDD